MITPLLLNRRLLRFLISHLLFLANYFAMFKRQNGCRFYKSHRIAYILLNACLHDLYLLFDLGNADFY